MFSSKGHYKLEPNDTNLIVDSQRMYQKFEIGISKHVSNLNGVTFFGSFARSQGGLIMKTCN